MDYQDEDNHHFGQSNMCRDLLDPVGMRETRTNNIASGSGTGSVHPVVPDDRGLTRRAGETMTEFFQRCHNADCRIISFNEPSQHQIYGGVICAAQLCFDPRCPNNKEGYDRLKDLMEKFKASAVGLSVQNMKFESYRALERPEGRLG